MTDIGFADPGMYTQFLHRLQGNEAGADHYSLSYFYGLYIDKTGRGTINTRISEFALSQLLADQRLLVSCRGSVDSQLCVIKHFLRNSLLFGKVAPPLQLQLRFF